MADGEDVVAGERRAHEPKVAGCGGQGQEAVDLGCKVHGACQLRTVLRQPPDELGADAALHARQAKQLDISGLQAVKGSAEPEFVKSILGDIGSERCGVQDDVQCWHSRKMSSSCATLVQPC